MGVKYKIHKINIYLYKKYGVLLKIKYFFEISINVKKIKKIKKKSNS